MNRVTFIDHCGFIVASEKVIMVFDMTDDPSHALHRSLESNPDLPVVFFVTNFHRDRVPHSIYELAQNRRRVYVMSNDVYPQNAPDSIEIAGMSAGDVIDTLPGGITVRAFATTGRGVAFLVTEPGGTKIFHSGDLRYNPDETERYKVIVNRIAEVTPTVDIAMIPFEDTTEGIDLFLEAVKVGDLFPAGLEKNRREACYALRDKAKDAIHCLETPGQSLAL